MPALARAAPAAFAVPGAVASVSHAAIIQPESKRRSARIDQGALTAPIDGLVKTNRRAGQNEEARRACRNKTATAIRLLCKTDAACMLGNMTELGVTGEHTTDGIPHGSTSLTPFLAIIGAEEALDFYRSVFDARIVDVTEFDGVVVHAELDFGSGKLQVGEPNPEYGLVPPPSEGACYSLGLYCPNVDDVVSRALAAGATLREEPSTFISGDRYASILDPFGVRWSIMSRVEDISESESARRVAEWAAGRATS